MMRTLVPFVAVVTVLTTVPTLVAAQQAVAFETASIRANHTPILDKDDSSIAIEPGGTLRTVNYPLRLLIQFAYQIQNFQLEAPDWTLSARFDIVARSSAGQPSPSILSTRMMLRNLLAERFSLVAHTETQDRAVYELVRARRDGQLGPKLRPATEDCAARRAALQSGAPPVPMAPPGPGGCGTSIRLGRIALGGLPLTTFADALSALAQRPVVDRSELAGNWEFELLFTPDPSSLQVPPGVPLPPPAPDVDPNGPSLFTALEDQLGLKLQPARGQIEIRVVDRVEQPTEN